MGIHYDLGDVLYFTGGHAGDDGVFCCLMMYDWNFNGEYQMQGFGADPSIANVKDKVEKKADQANKNALAANEISSGTDIPVDSDGKEDDIYIKYKDKTTYEPFYEIEYWGWVDDNRNPNYTFTKPDDMATLQNFEWDSANGGYKFNVTGQLYPYVRSNESASRISNGYFGIPVLEVHLPSTGKYKLVCDVSCDIETDKFINQLPAFSEFTQSTDTAGGVPSSSSKTFENHVIRHYEYQYRLTGSSVPSHLYMWFVYWCAYVSLETGVPMNITVSGLRLEKIIDEQTGETDGGVSSTTTREIEDIYVKETDPTTGNEVWKAIDYLAGADTSTGLNVNDKIVSLKPEVMRAWFKADPPQVKRNFNQYCVRFTGKPDTDIEISLQNNNGWLNKSIKKDSEGVFTLKSGGTVSSEVIEYCAYRITGLTSGQRYYFNFKANFKDGTTFGKDFTKGLGVVFNTTGVISTDDWEGDPGTFDEENLYCSFRRGTVGTFYDFSFVATASTMYMCIVVADITSGQTSSLTLSKLVISKTERAYVRNFYIFDTVSNDWLPYKPWGSGSDSGGDAGSSSLGDLDDVNLDDLSNGQTLYYNSATGEWVNGDPYELPIANANTLGGIKVGANLSIDENGVLSATASSDVELVELTQSQYDALTPEEKADPNVIYFVIDAGGGGGGGGGGSNVVITPTLSTGTKIADYSIDGVVGALYAPSGGGGGANVIFGTSEPTSQIGNDGDLYMKYVNQQGISSIFGKVSGGWLAFNMFIEYVWDFTKSLNAINNGTIISLSGATRSASGISFSGAAHYASIPVNLLQNGYTYEIEIASLAISNQSVNNRVFMFTDSNTHNAGVVWHGQTGKWGVWDSVNTWQDSNITDKDYFNDSVLKIVIDDNGYWHIYKDDVLIFEPANAITLKNTAFVLGASSNACYNMVISKFKIYPNQ
jgi:hypothetical protein